MTNLDITRTIELSEQIKNAYRATWDETRIRNEVSGEISPTQYDLTLVVKGGESLIFRYGETDSDGRKWQLQELSVEEADADWKSRYDREAQWIIMPDLIAQMLWDVVTVHGQDAVKRGWSDINRDGVPEPMSDAELMEKGGVIGMQLLEHRAPQKQQGSWTEVG